MLKRGKWKKIKKLVKKVIKNFVPQGVIKIAKKLRARLRTLVLKRLVHYSNNSWYIKALKTADWQGQYVAYRAKSNIENKWILYESSAGAGMICNPYALFKAFMGHPDFRNYRHIWAIRDLEELRRLREKYSDYKNVLFIMYGSSGYAYCLAKSKYLINNTSFSSVFSIRQEQQYLNTWHSITVKSLGFDIPDGNRISKNMIRNLLMADYIISPNEFMTDIFNRSYRLCDLYEGKYIEHGFPRNDLVVNTKRDEVLRKLASRGIVLDANKKIILYAPTWKGHTVNKPKVDLTRYEELYDYLSQHTNMDKYQIIIKPHQYTYKAMPKEEKAKNRYVPYTIDTNELLSAVDILITDYSSIYFDYLIVDRPILFYIPDYDEYQEERGIYFKLDELPGPYTSQLSQLAEYINNIDQVSEAYKDIRDETKAWACKFDDGNVSSRVLDVFIRGNTSSCRVIDPEKKGKKKLLFYIGMLNGNGVTTAGLNLLRSLDYDRYDVSLFAYSLKDSIQNWYFDQIPKEVRVFLRTSGPKFARGEDKVYAKTLIKGLLIDESKKDLQKYLMRREYIRCFGNARWDYIIDFNGYSAYYPCLTLLGAGDNSRAKYFIWQHNDLAMDFGNKQKMKLNKRSLKLDGLRSIYDRFDKIVSVAKPIYEINKANFSTEETAHKFTYCTNFMDENRISQCLKEKPFLEQDNWLAVRKDLTQPAIGIVDVTLIPYFRNAVKFVTMGRCMPEKNHKNLIKATKKLIDEGEDTVLYIIGDGVLKDKLIKLSQELGISDRVIVTGFLNNPFLLLRQCDCFIFPSLYEAQPMAILEARCVGLPIVLSNYGAVESMLLDDQQFILRGTDEESIYEGMKAYLNGEVPCSYTFEIEEYNKKGKAEFKKLLEDL